MTTPAKRHRPTVWGYIRDATGDALALALARGQIELLCERAGFVLQELIIEQENDGDQKLSGFTTLLDALERPEARAVVVPGLDHLSSDPRQQAKLVKQVERARCVVFAADALTMATLQPTFLLPAAVATTYAYFVGQRPSGAAVAEAKKRVAFHCSKRALQLREVFCDLNIDEIAGTPPGMAELLRNLAQQQPATVIVADFDHTSGLRLALEYLRELTIQSGGYLPAIVTLDALDGQWVAS